MTRVLTLSFVALSLQYVAAQVSLIVPFVDEQPLSADVLGVDTALDRTTWALHQGSPTGTFTDDEGSFPGTATLVEGSDYVSFTYVLVDDQVTHTAGGVCSIQGGTEICVANADGQAATETDPATAFVVQAAATTGAPAPGASSNSAPSAAGKSGGGGAATGSSPDASAPSASTKDSGAIHTTSAASAFAGLIGVALGVYFA
ncbi:hypothetical protein FB45DRAFT_1148569 [Roridomyces roridus]|uniref:Uncharacterized protein n=1 Tax=Roridomyces roridus TaxID=1738132 RepID=A0AAD7BXI4_9AGAR|nr:hypothetical protein FB45DRAFT_1148569 [Roridomyces roridus]